MRCYLPALMDELDLDVLPPRQGWAVTDQVRALLPEEDDEGLEYWAQTEAAQASVDLIRGTEAPCLRVVVVAQVRDADVAELELGAVEVSVPVSFDDVVCLLVDEPDAAADVAGAVDGDAEAQARVEDRDLLWYDVTERGHVPR
jgi:hypothetical protein